MKLGYPILLAVCLLGMLLGFVQLFLPGPNLFIKIQLLVWPTTAFIATWNAAPVQHGPAMPLHTNN